MSEVKRPILRYHGGKWLLAPWIISHFPKHRVYVEAFGGAASVMLRKPRSYGEVYNDLWDTVVNVFKIVRDPVLAGKLEFILRNTPFSRTEFLACGEMDLKNETDAVEKARKTILRSFAGFGSAATNSKYATGFRANASRSGTTPAHDWANYPDHIKSFTERFRGVTIESKNYQEVIEQQDSDETLFYLDPPYVHRTRNMKRGNAAYEFEFSDADHEELCKFVKRVKGMVLISGYDNEIYRDLLSDWELRQKKWFADGAAERIETLWISPNISLI